jgi:hypothetical protein
LIIAPGQLARLVDGMAARLTVVGVNVRRDRLEFATTAAIATLVGWSVAGPLFVRAAGGEPIGHAELRRELRRMLRAYLALP